MLQHAEALGIGDSSSEPFLELLLRAVRRQEKVVEAGVALREAARRKH
jgi:hypothetical protein